MANKLCLNGALGIPPIRSEGMTRELAITLHRRAIDKGGWIPWKVITAWVRGLGKRPNGRMLKHVLYYDLRLRRYRLSAAGTADMLEELANSN